MLNKINKNQKTPKEYALMTTIEDHKNKKIEDNKGRKKKMKKNTDIQVIYWILD